MNKFVDYLTELKEYGSSPVAKLHKLCVPFLALANCVLEAPEGHKPSKEIISTPRSTIDHPTSTIPGTSTFQAIPNPVPRLSIPHDAPMIEHSMVQNSHTPSALPALSPAPPDDMFWQLMDAQPRLQWLDSDFSGFEQAWGDAGLRDLDFIG